MLYCDLRILFFPFSLARRDIAMKVTKNKKRHPSLSTGKPDKQRERKTLTKRIKQAILERQNMRCAYCQRIITLTAYRLRDWKKILGKYPDRSVPSQAKFHHKNLRSKGGTSNPSNIVALCGRCHAKPHSYYKQYKKVKVVC